MATEKQGSFQMIFGRIPSMRDRGRRSSMGQQSGAGALHDAISKGKVHLARFIIEATEERTLVNVKDTHGKTPLIRACKHVDRNARIRAMELLIKHGADVNLKDNVGRTALSYACQLKHNDAVALLVKSNVDPNIEDNMSNTPLGYCAKHNNVGAIETIIRSFKRLGLNIDHANEEGMTPLMEAARNGYFQCVKILIQNGKASLTLRDQFRNLTAEEWAHENGCTPELLEIFQKKKHRRHGDLDADQDECNLGKSFDDDTEDNVLLTPEGTTPELRHKQIVDEKGDSGGLSPCTKLRSLKLDKSPRVPLLARRDRIGDATIHRLYGRPRSATCLEYMSRSFDSVEREKQDQKYRLSASHECLVDLTSVVCPSLPISLSISVENIRRGEDGNDLRHGSSSDLLQRVRRFTKSPTLLRNRPKRERSESPERAYFPPI
ncbi:uncharacterized protein [Antedon mediterranea]|uniref:uncharacterized protein n=1 Tax=Antedon mediterranea TaxID=105859 RepID=UPI003AF6AEE7